jgi:hypothetical protein
VCSDAVFVELSVPAPLPADAMTMISNSPAAHQRFFLYQGRVALA